MMSTVPREGDPSSRWWVPGAAALVAAAIGGGLVSCGGSAPPHVPRCETIERTDAEIHKVDDDIYVVRAKVLGRVPRKTISFILTGEGVVAIDTGAPASAEIAKAFLREITDEPLKWIVYSHHHGTQTAGARTLADPETKFIAQEDFPLEIRWMHDLTQFKRRLNNIQFDLKLVEDAEEEEDPPPPDVVFADEYVLELGGTRIELHHLEGEARDYAVAWLPDRKYLWVGDLATDTFPMIASPMKPVRDPLRWKQGVDWMMSLEPQVMVNAVDPPICSPAEIQRQLGRNSAIVGFVHDAVVEQMNVGASVEQAVRVIRLPPELQDVTQSYGSLEFAVRGVYDYYQGSYPLLGGSVFEPPPRAEVAQDFVRSMGGREVVRAKAQELIAAGERQIALQYIDLLIDSADDADANRMKYRVLWGLADRPSENRILSNMYRSLSRDALQRADRLSGVTTPAPQEENRPDPDEPHE